MSICKNCKHDSDYCVVSQTKPSRRWATCASYRKDDYDEVREEKTQTAEDSNRQRIVALIQANRLNCEGVG